jgi:cytidylate kinase
MQPAGIIPFTVDASRILKREFVERKQKGEFFTERELMDQHAYLKEEAAW